MKYKTLEKISLDEFVARCKKMPRVSKRKIMWLKLIKANKLTCPITGLVVDHVKYQYTYFGTRHYNFYSACNQNINIDHIIPLSKSGSKMDLDNIQPMLEIKNKKKGNKI